MDDQRNLGPYAGEVADWWPHVDLLRTLPQHLTDQGEQRSRSTVLRVELAGHPVAVKVFPATSAKAERSWVVARALEKHGIGTPRPIAYLEGEEATYFLTDWLDDISSFNRQLLHLLHDEFQYDKILNLMDVVAAEVRRMHDAGIKHGDMGNQNIVCRRKGEQEWGDVGFIDLNRGRVRDELSMDDRAFDCSRLTLPSRLLKNFLSMYWRDRYREGKRPPKEFMKRLARYRWRFRLHSKTRPLRHPIRAWKKSRVPDTKPRYPMPKDYWVWDDRTHQAIGVLMKKDRLPLMPVLPMIKTGVIAAGKFLPARARFSKLREQAFEKPVSLAGGIGMTLTPDPKTIDLERRYLSDLGHKLPVLLRFYHHDDDERRDWVAGLARELHAEGYPVAAAFIQSRKAITNPASWEAMLHRAFDRIGPILTEVEIGHAINRLKWGLWSPEEYVRLLDPWRSLHELYPHVRLLGPAVNDFEFHYLASALAQVPKDIRIDATSLHLYVDRRGAPENEQKILGGSYSSVDKFAWARALGGEVVITEFNWPLKDPGGYMPEFNPYFWKGNRALDTTVTEEEQGWYLVRYFLLALCSGMVKRAYWWHLASPLFGIVDTTVEGWRARPAHGMLRDLLARVGDARFVEKDPDHWLLRFEKPDGSRFAIGWTVKGEETVDGRTLTPSPTVFDEA
ncbi:MAG: lipopolysaccharide kinase InaA family protein [Planctomycetota bacterium]